MFQSRYPVRAAVLAGASSLILAACGGGSGSTPVAPAPGGGTPPPQADSYVTVQGEITGFGSVIVGGTRYDTDTASVRKDGNDASLSDLSVGQIVAIRARRNGDGELPTALRVRYEETLEGPVEAIAADGRSLTVLGLTVFLTDDTVYEDDLDPAAIAIDDVLEISGSFTANGDLVASYVEISDNVDGDYEVHGTVGGLDETAQTFRVRGLKIGYASAALADFEGDNVLSNGDKVEVEGSVFLNDGTLVATRVEYEGDDLDDLEGDEADDDDEEELEIKGFISVFTDATSFEIDGQPVATDSDTEFSRCTAEDLALDVEVEVEGELDENGVLVADKVKCEVEPNRFITGAVDDVSEADSTVTLFGVPVSVTADTSFQDKGPNRVRDFGLDDIAVDDIVRVQAYTLPGQDTLFAKRIRRESAGQGGDVTAEVKGNIDAINTDDLVVAGITILFGETATYEIDDIETNRAEFVAQLSVGDRIVVRGEENDDGQFVGTKFSFEFDDDDDDDNETED